MQFQREIEKQVENVKKTYSNVFGRHTWAKKKKEANQIFIRCKADFNSWRWTQLTIVSRFFGRNVKPARVMQARDQRSRSIWGPINLPGLRPLPPWHHGIPPLILNERGESFRALASRVAKRRGQSDPSGAGERTLAAAVRNPTV